MILVLEVGFALAVALTFGAVMRALDVPPEPEGRVTSWGRR